MALFCDSLFGVTAAVVVVVVVVVVVDGKGTTSNAVPAISCLVQIFFYCSLPFTLC